jgi:Tol biopolymer transport system component
MTDTASTSLPATGISAFDKVVAATMAGLVLLAVLLVWRGDRVGVTIVQVSPGNGAENVSTQAALRVTFGQEMVKGQPAFTVSPPVTGTVSWEGRTLVFVPGVPLLPDTEYTVTLAAGLASQQGREVLSPLRWQFRTGRPRILYVGWDEQHSGNRLYIIAPEGGPPTQLTPEEHNVLDYAVAPDGQRIVYTVLRDEGGSDFWLIAPDGSNGRQLLACPGAACSQPVWSPDGQRIIYERRNIPAPGSPAGTPRLWWLSPVSGETVAVFQDSQWLGLGARFSPDGRWISYVSPLNQEVQAYHLASGRTVLIPSKTGEPAAWSPDGDALLVTEIQFQGERFSVYIFSTDLESTELTNLSGDLEVNDGLPVWSPDGAWIVFGRKIPRAPMGTQLWLMRPDGSDTIALTNNADIHYGQPAWSPNSGTLAFQYYILAEPGAEPGIGLVDIESGELREIAAPGVQPSWLP